VAAIPPAREDRERLDGGVRPAFSRPKGTCVPQRFGVARRQLDEPVRLRDHVRLADLTQQLARFRQTYPPAVIEPMWRLFSDVAQRQLKGNPSKLVLEMSFLVEQMQDLQKLADLAMFRAISYNLDQEAERLKNAAERAKREDLKELATRFSEAGKNAIWSSSRRCGKSSMPWRNPTIWAT